MLIRKVRMKQNRFKILAKILNPNVFFNNFIRKKKKIYFLIISNIKIYF